MREYAADDGLGVAALVLGELVADVGGAVWRRGGDEGEVDGRRAECGVRDVRAAGGAPACVFRVSAR